MANDIDIAFRNRRIIRFSYPRNLKDRIKDGFKKLFTGVGYGEIVLESPPLRFYREDLPPIMRKIGSQIFLLVPYLEKVKKGENLDWQEILILSKPLTDGIVEAVGIIVKKDPKWIDEKTDLANFIYLITEILKVIDIKRIVNLGGEIKSILSKDRMGSGD
jgi:hypothetical protein